MRNFQTLDGSKLDPELDTLEIFYTTSSADHPALDLRREGLYITISASFGPLEIALRPKYEDLVRTLSRLTPIEGLHTTRQVGTGQAYLAMGLTSEGNLLLRPTIVADATGHLSLNIEIGDTARQALYAWLKVPNTPVAH